MWEFGRSTCFQYNGLIQFAVIECWGYENGTTSASPRTVVHRYDEYSQDQILRRLQEPIPLRDGNQPSLGFQMVAVSLKRRHLPQLGEPVLQALNEALGLPHSHHHYSSWAFGAIGLFQLPDDSWLLARPRTWAHASTTTILRYNPHANITRGIFYTNATFSDFKGIMAEFELCPHPLILPLLALEFNLLAKVDALGEHEKTLQEVERSTGHGVEGEGTLKEGSADYRVLVKSLSRARSGTHTAVEDLQSMEWCVEFILKKIKFMDDRLPPDTRAKLGNSSMRLQERAEFMLSATQHAMLSGNKERFEAQHTTLFNLITQHDSLSSMNIAQDSREIANASRHDSSAMKAITILATFFLPGTFISTFFSMELFDWDAPSISQVAKPHFWIFWAVTAPLTLITMALVVKWAFGYSMRAKETDKAGKADFKQAIAGQVEKLKSATKIQTTHVV